MAKSKKTVLAVREGGGEREFTKEQWDSMKQSKSTYGWRSKADIPEDVTAKEKEIEKSQLADLQSKFDAYKASSDESVKSLKTDNANLQKKIEELTSKPAPKK